MGKSSMNGQFPMAMLNNQRVDDLCIHIYIYIQCVLQFVQIDIS